MTLEELWRQLEEAQVLHRRRVALLESKVDLLEERLKEVRTQRDRVRGLACVLEDDLADAQKMLNLLQEQVASLSQQLAERDVAIARSAREGAERSLYPG